MKRKYNKPTVLKVRIDNQINVWLMSEETPPGGPFSNLNDTNTDRKQNPYKA